ncbi:hypothetical protein [Haloactinomyces albus]|uniref:Uncharacterized protein n=1 Tax=Haloactinomyces albus TaxID=1352928 RepID=A0AAE3ZGC0_9ACTN|nr:hypothetical protein [Haloactinomyces albus]MDR7302707.1 hypothetical protein [Haloactinomyces albus]
MHPQQPYGHQQLPPQQPYQQIPQPVAYGPPDGAPQPPQQGWPPPTGPLPSGITTIVAAVLGALLGLAWITLIVAVLVTVGSDDIEVEGVLVVSGFAVALGVPPLIGSIGLFVRRKFGRWVLIVGLALSVIASAFLVATALDVSSAPPTPFLFGTPVLVFSIAGVVLAALPTTGRYLAAAKSLRAARQAATVHSQQPYAPMDPWHFPQQPYRSGIV